MIRNALNLKKKKLKLFKRNCDHSKNDHNTSVIHV